MFFSCSFISYPEVGASNSVRLLNKIHQCVTYIQEFLNRNPNEGGNVKFIFISLIPCCQNKHLSGTSVHKRRNAFPFKVTIKVSHCLTRKTVHKSELPDIIYILPFKYQHVRAKPNITFHLRQNATIVALTKLKRSTPWKPIEQQITVQQASWQTIWPIKEFDYVPFRFHTLPPLRAVVARHGST